jgi:hypothetical protein
MLLNLPKWYISYSQPFGHWLRGWNEKGISSQMKLSPMTSRHIFRKLPTLAMAP